MSDKCFFCGHDSDKNLNHEKDLVFYNCPICGRYEISLEYMQDNYDKNKTMHYLYYNAFLRRNMPEYRYFTCRPKEECDEYKREFEKGNNIIGVPVHMDNEMIELWYPKSFSERVDLILLKLNKLAKHLGQKVKICDEEQFSLLFVDKYESNDDYLQQYTEWRDRKKGECIIEAGYMLDYLSDNDYIEGSRSTDNTYNIRILPKGYARIDELQKNTSNGRNVLVAMKFGDDTLKLREAIRKGIADSGFCPEFIDEVPHNEFITPELLKHIRDSKFVVVDLTHQNNGAYFEEGYAMGLGKTVIQLCCKSTDLHFDVAQKNTIFWEAEDEIPLKLTNRIKATIE